MIFNNTNDNFTMEPLGLKLDIEDFIESYLTLINPENSPSLVSHACKSEFLPDSPCLEFEEIRELEKPTAMNFLVPPKRKLAIKQEPHKSCSDTKITKTKSRKDRTIPKSQQHMFNNNSQYVDEHSKRRRLFVRKNSNSNTKGIPASLQFNFPVITFHTLEIKK